MWAQGLLRGVVATQLSALLEFSELPSAFRVVVSGGKVRGKRLKARPTRSGGARLVQFDFHPTRR